MVEPTRPLVKDALARFGRQPQSVSYTDCVVMALADASQTKRIFGFDQAFARNGYTIIPQAAENAA